MMKMMSEPTMLNKSSPQQLDEHTQRGTLPGSIRSSLWSHETLSITMIDNSLLAGTFLGIVMSRRTAIAGPARCIRLFVATPLPIPPQHRHDLGQAELSILRDLEGDQPRLG
jgi:hypothetical protein